jgi:tRNA wybutosine-synthesizing protein 1
MNLYSQIWYGNVGHPRLSSYVKDNSWLNRTGEHLVFPAEESEFKGGAKHYIETIDEVTNDGYFTFAFDAR